MSSPASPASHPVHRGTAADAAAIGRLLHDFNTEYDDPTPGPDKLAARIEQLIAAIELARAEGADYMDLGTAESDVAARALYESLGFSNREGKPDGPVNYFYERDL